MPSMTAHENWIAAGYCPVISHTKAWCDRKAGHPWLHSSPRQPNPGEPVSLTNPTRVYWED